MDVIRLGNLTFNVPRQALISFYAWVVILACMLVMLMIDNTMFAMRFFFFVLYVGMAVLSIYAIHCYVVGKCIKLAWVFVALQVFVAVVNVIALLTLVALRMKKPVSMKKSR